MIPRNRKSVPHLVIQRGVQVGRQFKEPVAAFDRGPLPGRQVRRTATGRHCPAAGCASRILLQLVPAASGKNTFRESGQRVAMLQMASLLNGWIT